MQEVSENRTITQCFHEADDKVRTKGAGRTRPSEVLPFQAKRPNCVIFEGVEHAGPEVARYLVGLATGKTGKGQRRVPIIGSCNNLCVFSRS